MSKFGFIRSKCVKNLVIRSNLVKILGLGQNFSVQRSKCVKIWVNKVKMRQKFGDKVNVSKT